jgi:hypothetical protein
MLDELVASSQKSLERGKKEQLPKGRLLSSDNTTRHTALGQLEPGTKRIDI